MFLRGSFSFVFFLAINVDRPGQYGALLRNLQAVYRRFCREERLPRAFCANGALYAKPANALSRKVFSEVVDLASGDVVQLFRTLPSNLIYKVSSLLSITFQEDVGSGILTNSSRIPKYLRTGFHLSPNRLALRQHCNPENASTPSLLVAHPWMILGVCRGCCRIHSTASVPSRASRTGRSSGMRREPIWRRFTRRSQ